MAAAATRVRSKDTGDSGDARARAFLFVGAFDRQMSFWPLAAAAAEKAANAPLEAFDGDNNVDEIFGDDDLEHLTSEWHLAVYNARRCVPAVFGGIAPLFLRLGALALAQTLVYRWRKFYI